jgi:hypothetical protein
MIIGHGLRRNLDIFRHNQESCGPLDDSSETSNSLKSTVFWDITPCSPLKVNRCCGGTYRFHLQGRKISRAICSSEISFDFQRTTRRYIPEDSTFHNHSCENLKSYNGFYVVILSKRVTLPSVFFLSA